MLATHSGNVNETNREPTSSLSKKYSQTMTSNKQSCTILLVEDNPAHAELVLRGFEELPFANRIQHVSDGEEALDYLFRRGPFADPDRSPRPHLILMDLRLPKIDGVEIIGEIKSCAQFQQIPIVVLSTSNAESDASRAPTAT